jgi:cytochrome c oxidase subunit IV
MHEHVTPIKTYVGIWALLIVLTVTTALVSEIELGPWNIVLAMAIAVTKATLVVLIFMHVKWGSSLTKLFVVGGLGWLAILLAITLSDYYSRGWLPLGSWW